MFILPTWRMGDRCLNQCQSLFFYSPQNLMYLYICIRCPRRPIANHHQSFFSLLSESPTEWFCVVDCCLFDYILFHIVYIAISFCRSRVSNNFTNTLNSYDTNKRIICMCTMYIYVRYITCFIYMIKNKLFIPLLSLWLLYPIYFPSF